MGMDIYNNSFVRKFHMHRAFELHSSVLGSKFIIQGNMVDASPGNDIDIEYTLKINDSRFGYQVDKVITMPVCPDCKEDIPKNVAFVQFGRHVCKCGSEFQFGYKQSRMDDCRHIIEVDPPSSYLNDFRSES